MTSTQARLVRSADAEAIAEAARCLRAGGLVAFPTETVYGLGADATDERAVARIFAAKGRPKFNPLISHFADAEGVRAEVAWSDRAEAVAARFWPGPLTLVLPRRPDSRIALLCSAGLDSLAVRVPSHPVGHALLRAVDRPVAAPSANRSGAVSPTAAHHVAESLGTRVDLILDGGPCTLGLESTVLDLTGSQPRLLRPGNVTRGDLESLLGPLAAGAEPNGDTAPKAPGQLASHYAPALPLRLNATEIAADEALLAFGANPPSGAHTTPEPQRSGKSDRGRREPLRPPARPRLIGCPRHRRHAGARAGPRRGDQRPPAPRRRAATRLNRRSSPSPLRGEGYKTPFRAEPDDNGLD